MSEAADSWTSFFDRALSWVYPVKCPLCSMLSETCPCEACSTSMEPARPNLVAEVEGELGFRACVFAFEGRAAQAVRRLKYSRSTSLAGFMRDLVASRLSDLAVEGDLVVPVPMNLARQVWRGFNQAELIACGSHGFEISSSALKRIRNTRPQVGLSLRERQENLRGAFRADISVQGRRVILVDDVVTSGQTARECAKVLAAAGAVSVGIVAFAGNLE
jgi:ComF family protein